jgi:hypothetical protein
VLLHQQPQKKQKKKELTKHDGAKRVELLSPVFFLASCLLGLLGCGWAAENWCSTRPLSRVSFSLFARATRNTRFPR